MIPLGMTMLFIGIDKGYNNLSYVAGVVIVFGVLSWINAYRNLQTEEIIWRNERRHSDELLTTLINELKGLRGDLRNKDESK